MNIVISVFFMFPYFSLSSSDFCNRDTASSLSLVLRFGFLGPTLRTVSPAQYQRKHKPENNKSVVVH